MNFQFLWFSSRLLSSSVKGNYWKACRIKFKACIQVMNAVPSPVAKAQNSIKVKHQNHVSTFGGDWVKAFNICEHGSCFLGFLPERILFLHQEWGFSELEMCSELGKRADIYVWQGGQQWWKCHLWNETNHVTDASSCPDCVGPLHVSEISCGT